MKDRQHKSKWGRNLLVVLLAVACICAAELFACRYFAPELYAQVTAPVRRGLEAVSDLGERLLTLLPRREEAAPDPEPEAPVSQLASQPALEDGLPYADPIITELTQRDGRDVLTGGSLDLLYFNQGDEAWVDQPYGTDQIGGYGCGPTAMAMAVSSMTDSFMDPAQMAQWAADNGYWAKGCGSYLSIVEGTAAGFGLSAQPFRERTPEALRLELATGTLMVALMKKGHFTLSGHFILLRGITLSGGILVADPNSTERSLAVWDPQIILDELSESTSNGAPLWSLSKPK